MASLSIFLRSAAFFGSSLLAGNAQSVQSTYRPMATLDRRQGAWGEERGLIKDLTRHGQLAEGTDQVLTRALTPCLTPASAHMSHHIISRVQSMRLITPPLPKRLDITCHSGDSDQTSAISSAAGDPRFDWVISGRTASQVHAPTRGVSMKERYKPQSEALPFIHPRRFISS